MEVLHRPPPIRGGLYVVGYFDLLGQSNALLPYVNVDGSDEYIRGVQQAFNRISSQIYAFRSDIREFFEGAKLSGLTDSAPPNTPAEALLIAAEFEKEPIRLQGFSDTVIAYVPIATELGLALFRVGAMLISVASTMLFSIARGAMVRGAIDASWAMEIGDGEIYGPALLCAYDHERRAGWPRVVVGDELRKLWLSVVREKPQSPNDLMNVIFSTLQSGLCFEDKDGKIVVDYLGSTMRQLIEGGVDDLAALIDAAHVELERQFAKHQADAKILGKLRETLDYFVARAGPLTPERRLRAKRYEKLRHPDL